MINENEFWLDEVEEIGKRLKKPAKRNTVLLQELKHMREWSERRMMRMTGVTL